MIVYHASTEIVYSPDIFHSRDSLDFGKGFYLTTFRQQAIKYAERFLLRGKKAYLNIYEFHEPQTGLSIKKFSSYDNDWLDFVSSCRRNLDNSSYDIILGGIANDKVFRTIDLYFAGDLNKEEALKRLIFEKPNNQLCLRSTEAIDHCLKFIDYEEIHRNG